MPSRWDIFRLTDSLSDTFMRVHVRVRASVRVRRRSLRLCLSFLVFFFGPLARRAIRGLIESCEAQVGFGCGPLPTGIRRRRASAKSAAYIDPESLRTQRCLNQGEANTHNGAHTKACLLWHGRMMCKSTLKQRRYLIKTGAKVYSVFSKVLTWNYSTDNDRVWRVHVGCPDLVCHQKTFFFLLWICVTELKRMFSPRLLQKFGKNRTELPCRTKQLTTIKWGRLKYCALSVWREEHFSCFGLVLSLLGHGWRKTTYLKTWLSALVSQCLLCVGNLPQVMFSNSRKSQERKNLTPLLVMWESMLEWESFQVHIYSIYNDN